MESIDKPVSPAAKVKTDLGPLVDSADLHGAIMLPDGGGTHTTISKQKVKGPLIMHWVKGEGILIDYKGKKSIIPAMNVKVARLV